MGFFSRLREVFETRSYSQMRQQMQQADVFGTNITSETALRISAVYAATNLISETLATTPLYVKQNTDKGQVAREDHHLNDLLNLRPNVKQTAVVWRQAMQGQALLNGHGCSYIERNNAGQPIAFHYVNAGEVFPQVIKPNTLDEEVVWNIPKFNIVALKDEVIWVPAFTTSDTETMSPIKYASVMLGGAYAAMQFNASAYKKGGFFKGVITLLGKLGSGSKTPAQRAKEIGTQFDEMFADGTTPVLYDGNTYTPLNMRHVDLQFIEYMRYTVEDIARIFNVPLAKLKSLDTSAAVDVEGQQLEFVTDTMQPWFTKWENELTDKLLTALERKNGLVIKFDSKALLLGSYKSRAEYYTKLFYLGAKSPNEIRIAEGETKRDGGDMYFSGVNLVTQKQVELQTQKMQMELDLGLVTDAFAPANSNVKN